MLQHLGVKRLQVCNLLSNSSSKNSIYIQGRVGQGERIVNEAVC